MLGHSECLKSSDSDKSGAIWGHFEAILRISGIISSKPQIILEDLAIILEEVPAPVCVPRRAARAAAREMREKNVWRN